MSNMISTDTVGGNSVLSRLSEIHEAIRQTYLQYPYPWVIGYSGGKDSTTTLQLCWYALRELPPGQLTKPIYVISTDTQVETPVIVDRIKESIDLMNRAAAEQGVKLTAHSLYPF